MSAVESSWAHALIRVARETGELERTASELESVSKIVAGYKSFFFSPVVQTEEKTSLLTEIFGEEVSKLVLEFICLMIRRRAVRLLPAVAERFAQLAEQELDVVKIILRIPFQPDEQLLQKLSDKLASLGMFPESKKKNVEFEIVLDSSLLGGFTAEYNGRLIDQSLRTRIAEAGKNSL